MKLRTLATAAVFAGMLSGVATAQVQVTVTAPNAPGSARVVWDPADYSAFYVSPYSGTVTVGGSTQNVVLNCVDFFHTATLNTPYSANQSYLTGSLSNTRFNNLTWYLQAAWLTQQYGANPGSDANRTIAIQAAIWNIFTTNAPDRDASSNYSVNDQDYWIAQARANWQTVDASKFYVLTGVNNGPQQEFLVYNPSAVPEPATMTLLGTGLAGLAAAHRRRRKARG